MSHLISFGFEPFFNSLMHQTQTESHKIWNAEYPRREKFESFKATIAMTSVTIPVELLASLENILALPFQAIAAVPKYPIKLTAGVVWCVSAKWSRAISGMQKNLPGIFDLVYTVYKIVALTFGTFLTASLGLFISSRANYWMHAKLGLISKPTEQDFYIQSRRGDYRYGSLERNDSKSYENLGRSNDRNTQTYSNEHTKTISQLQSTNKELSQALENRDKTLSSKEQAIRELNTKVQSLESAIQNLRTQFTSSSYNKQEYENKLAQIQRELDQAKQEILSYKGKEQSFTTTQSNLQSQVQQLKQTIEDQQRKLASIPQQSSNKIVAKDYEEDVKEFQHAHLTLLDDVTSKTRQLEEQEKTIQYLNAKILELSTQSSNKEEYERRLLAIQQELNEAKEAIAFYQVSFSTAQNDLVKQKTGLTEQLEKANQQVDLLQTQLTAAKTFEQTNQQLEASLQESQTQNQTKQTEIESLNKQLQQLKQELQQIQQQEQKTQAIANQSQDLQKQVEQLKQQLTNWQQRVEEQNKTIEQKDKAYSQLVEQHNQQLLANMASFEEQTKTFTAQQEQLNASLQAKQEYLSQLGQAIADDIEGKMLSNSNQNNSDANKLIKKLKSISQLPSADEYKTLKDGLGFISAYQYQVTAGNQTHLEDDTQDNTVVDLKNQIEILRQQLATLQQDQTIKIQTAAEQLTKYLKEEISQLENQIDSLTKGQNVQIKLNAEQLAAPLRKELATVKEQLSNLQQVQETKQKTLNETQENYDKLIQDYNEMVSFVGLSKTEIQDLQTKNEELKSKLAANDSQYRSIAPELEKEKEQIKEISAKKERWASKARDRKETIKKLEAELREVKKNQLNQNEASTSLIDSNLSDSSINNNQMPVASQPSLTVEQQQALLIGHLQQFLVEKNLQNDFLNFMQYPTCNQTDDES